jgi:hypothetical protein
LPALLLMGVALVQALLVRKAGLSPWKGGGFGMFSTLDEGPRRRVRIVVEAPGRSEELEAPPSLRDLAARAATLPTTARLDRLARAVAARERRDHRPVANVRLQVLGVEFDGSTLRASERLIREATVAVAP